MHELVRQEVNNFNGYREVYTNLRSQSMRKILANVTQVKIPEIGILPSEQVSLRGNSLRTPHGIIRIEKIRGNLKLCMLPLTLIISL